MICIWKVYNIVKINNRENKFHLLSMLISNYSSLLENRETFEVMYTLTKVDLIKCSIVRMDIQTIMKRVILIKELRIISKANILIKHLQLGFAQWSFPCDFTSYSNVHN